MTRTIYDLLRDSHEVQRSLLRKLLRSGTEGRTRQQLLREVRIELAAHAAAEERFLYAPMLMDDGGLQSSRHALAEHHQIDELVEDLGKADAEGGSWLAQARQLSKKVHHHLREEETKFFQVSGKILTVTEKRRLGTQYQHDYRRMHQKLAAN